MLMQPRPRAETSRLLLPSFRVCIVLPVSYYQGLRCRATWAAILLVGDESTPRGAVAFVVDLPHRKVGHEVVGGRAVPVPLSRRRVDHVAGADLDDLAAARLHQPTPLGHVQRLAAWMGVPGGAGARCEPDDVDAHAGVVFPPRDDVVPDVPGERLGRALDTRLPGLNLHVESPSLSASWTAGPGRHLSAPMCRRGQCPSWIKVQDSVALENSPALFPCSMLLIE